MTNEQEGRLRQAFTYQISVELARMRVQMIPPGSGMSALGMKIVGQEWRGLLNNCPDYEAGRVNEYKAAYTAAKRAAERLRQEGFTIPASYMPVIPWQHTRWRKGVTGS